MGRQLRKTFLCTFPHNFLKKWKWLERGSQVTVTPLWGRGSPPWLQEVPHEAAEPTWAELQLEALRWQRSTAEVRKGPGLLQGQILMVQGPGAWPLGEVQELGAAQQLWGCVLESASNAGDRQGGEEAQEISQWLYGQHRVSCSSLGAGAAPGPDCTGPSPRSTPAPAPRPGPCGTHRLEGRGPLCGAGGGHGPALLQGFSLCGDILPCMQPGSSTLLILAVPSLTGSAPRGQAWAEFGSCWPCHSSVRRDTSRLGTVPRGSVPCPPLAGLLPVPWPLGAVLPQCAQLPPARAQGVGQDRARAAGAPWGRCSQPHGTQQSGAGF